MFIKKLREKIYNRKIEKELKDFKNFDNMYYEIYSDYPKFVEYNSKGEQKIFEPKTIYALKRAIQKLSFNYVSAVSIEEFDSDLTKMFAFTALDHTRQKECSDLYKSKKMLNLKSEKLFENEELNLVKKFLSFYGFNWNGKFSSINSPDPKMATKLEDLMPEEECTFLYEDKGEGGFFMISKTTFCKFKYKGHDQFEIEANYENEWLKFQSTNKKHEPINENNI